jgi:hypothetical protein
MSDTDIQEMDELASIEGPGATQRIMTGWETARVFLRQVARSGGGTSGNEAKMLLFYHPVANAGANLDLSEAERAVIRAPYIRHELKMSDALFQEISRYFKRSYMEDLT